MPAQYYPWPIPLAWEVTQDCIQVPHFVNPRDYLIDSGDASNTLDYDADWGTGTGHRYLFVFVAHAPTTPSTPTYGGQAMTAVGTPTATCGLWRLESPPASGDLALDVYTGTPGDKATVLAIMFVGANPIYPATTHASAGTWDSASPLSITQSHGSRQSILTFLETTADHGEITSTTGDHLVVRPGALAGRRIVAALSPTVFGASTRTSTFAGSLSASGSYTARGCSLFQTAAQNAAQQAASQPWLTWSTWSPSVYTDQVATQGLRRLPAQFDNSPRIQALVAGTLAAGDASEARFRNLRALTYLSEAYGPYLDVWGERLAFPRQPFGEPLSDFDYRRALLAIMLARRSTGTYADIRAVAQQLFPNTPLTFTEPAPATILLTVGRTLRAQEHRLAETVLRIAKSVGVSLSVTLA